MTLLPPSYVPDSLYLPYEQTNPLFSMRFPFTYNPKLSGTELKTPYRYPDVNKKVENARGMKRKQGEKKEGKKKKKNSLSPQVFRMNRR